MSSIRSKGGLSAARVTSEKGGWGHARSDVHMLNHKRTRVPRAEYAAENGTARKDKIQILARTRATMAGGTVKNSHKSK